MIHAILKPIKSQSESKTFIEHLVCVLSNVKDLTKDRIYFQQLTYKCTEMFDQDLNYDQIRVEFIFQDLN